MTGQNLRVDHVTRIKLQCSTLVFVRQIRLKFNSNATHTVLARVIRPPRVSHPPPMSFDRKTLSHPTPLENVQIHRSLLQNHVRFRPTQCNRHIFWYRNFHLNCS